MRILVVEDEPTAARVLAKGLREHAFAVDIAVDGAAAMEQLEQSEYDLVILDLMLPRINGMDVCRRLRADASAVPILMLTARGGVEERVEGLNAGADDYLSKPYHFPELLARVGALLRRGPALETSALTLDDLVVDTLARKVTRGGRTIQLTTKEYALLEYLMRRQTQVVTRTDIADHVWDSGSDPVSNLIDVYIQRLRRKVDDGHAIKLIHTRRGAGYSLDAAPGDYDD
jgi:DNA-binding response OmpR family regulator